MRDEGAEARHEPLGAALHHHGLGWGPLARRPWNRRRMAHQRDRSAAWCARVEARACDRAATGVVRGAVEVVGVV